MCAVDALDASIATMTQAILLKAWRIELGIQRCVEVRKTTRVAQLDQALDVLTLDELAAIEFAEHPLHSLL